MWPERPGNVAYRDHILEQVAVLRDHGVTKTGMPTPETSSIEEELDYLRWFADEVLSVSTG